MGGGADVLTHGSAEASGGPLREAAPAGRRGRRGGRQAGVTGAHTIKCDTLYEMHNHRRDARPSQVVPHPTPRAADAGRAGVAALTTAGPAEAL